MKIVKVLGKTNLRPGQLAEIADMCNLEVFDENVPNRSIEEVVKRIARAEIVLINAFTPVDSHVLDRSPDLRAIISCSSGIDHVDLDACGKAGVRVRWFPGYCARTVAEKTLTSILMGLNRTMAAVDNVRSGQWGYLAFRGREVPGRLVGVCGLGSTGRIVRDLCLGLGFDVKSTNSKTSRAETREILSEVDVVTLHMDLNPLTRGFLRSDTLALLKEDVIIVNTARGALIDEDALVDFLATHPDSLAFLDVLSVEPPAKNHPLLALPNMIATPHVGWNSIESDAYLADSTLEAMRNVIQFGWTTESGELGDQSLLRHHAGEAADGAAH